MDKKELWDEMQEMLGNTVIPFEAFFNYYSSADIEDFYEFLKEEGY